MENKHTAVVQPGKPRESWVKNKNKYKFLPSLLVLFLLPIIIIISLYFTYTRTCRVCILVTHKVYSLHKRERERIPLRAVNWNSFRFLKKLKLLLEIEARCGVVGFSFFFGWWKKK